MKKLSIRYKPIPLMTVRRSHYWTDKMVYIVLANKSIQYGNGKRSHILYIGTTRKGAPRPASNAATKAIDAFGEIHGVKSVQVRILSCKPRRNVQTWEELESALLVFFKFIYGRLPHFNKKLERYRDPFEVKSFKHERLVRLLKGFEHIAT